MGLADGPIPLRLPDPAGRPDRAARCWTRWAPTSRPCGSARRRRSSGTTPFGVDLIVPERFDVEDLPDGSSVVRNPQGAIYAKRAADAYYHDPVGHAAWPASRRPAELDRFDALFERWDYSYIYDEPLEALAERAKQQYQATDRAVVTLWRLHYLQAGMLMRGYEQFLIDLMADKDLAHAMLGEAARGRTCGGSTRSCAAFGPWFDIVFLTDDLGTQQVGR